MMNGLIVKRGTEYLARKNCKSTYADDFGWCWSTEAQAARIYREQRSAEMAARIYQNHDTACRAARQVGGVVRMMKNGRVEEQG